MRPLLIVLVLLSSQSLFAADTGPLPLSVGVPLDDGGVDWSIPGAGGSVSSVTGGGGQWSDINFWSGDLSSVPVGATIDGIVLSVTVRSDGGGARGYAVSRVSGGAVVAYMSGETGVAWGVVNETRTYGDPAELVGSGVTRADLVAAGFGFGVQCEWLMPDTGYVESVTATIYYTPGAVADEVEWWERSDCLLCWLLALLLGVHLVGVSCRFRSNRIGRGLV